MPVRCKAGGSHGKESACNPEDLGSAPMLGRFPGEGNGNPLQYSCLENSMDRGAWQATVYKGLKKLDMTEQLTHTGTRQVNCSVCFPAVFREKYQYVLLC